MSTSQSIRFMRYVLCLLAASVPGLGLARPCAAEAPPLNAVQQTVILAIDRGVVLFNRGEAEACAAVYEVAATALLAAADASQGLTAAGREALEQAMTQAQNAEDDTARAWALRAGLDQALLAAGGRPFRPIMEAALPDGFPEPGPVGRVIIKSYPAYRAARAQGGQETFNRLFRHIKANDIAMTAPVEMTLGREAKPAADAAGDAPGRLRTMDMAFLYERPDMGRVGQAGDVEVVDLPARTVLSVGIRGPVSAAVLAQESKRLDAALAEQADRYRAAGPLRLMGYNSPFIPAALRFHELQLPIEPLATQDS